MKKHKPNIVKSLAPWCASWQDLVENPSSLPLTDVLERIGGSEIEGQKFVSTVVAHVVSGRCHLHQLTALVELCAELTTRHSYMEGLWVCAMITPSTCG